MPGSEASPGACHTPGQRGVTGRAGLSALCPDFTFKIKFFDEKAIDGLQAARLSGLSLPESI
jgi:hypothetical protein